MKAEARVELDPASFGVRLIVRRDFREGESHLLTWGTPTVTNVRHDEVTPDDVWMRLDEDVARAIYESLAEWFGHAANDVRMLRRDYDAERKRVDTFIRHLTDGAA